VIQVLDRLQVVEVEQEACVDRATTVGTGHGQTGKRMMEATTWLDDHLGADRPGCRQVYRLERQRLTAEEVEHELVLGTPTCLGRGPSPPSY
jgi:hypothetical protein